MCVALFLGCGPSLEVDVVLRGGTIYDGSGTEGVTGDVALRGDSIVAVGDVGPLTGATEIDVRGLAVAPGFINMLSWATESLLEDGTAQSDIRQGVTLEVFGEGESMGPLNERMKEDMVRFQGDIQFDIAWTTLGEYLEHLEDRGVAVNVASFVGATAVRVHELGYADRPPTAEELRRMQDLVREAMAEGALGVGSSLIYAPAFYADTPELVALVEAAAESGGMYISHMRSEGNRLVESVDELIRIARESGAAAEIYHLKAAGRENWSKMDEVIRRVEEARAEGLRITAEMRTPTGEWENLALAAGSPDRVLLVGFRADSLKHLTGMSLAEAAALYGTTPEEVAMDLVVKDGSRVGTVYFMMDEENVMRQIALPWVSFGSDAGALAIREPFTLSNPHPRAYGNFSRLLGTYVRQQGVITMTEAVRRLTSLPAESLGLRRRGRLRAGYFADVVVFDPATVTDHATFEEPHQYASGVVHVFVNGEPVLRDGEPTGARPGRVVRGPGWKGWTGEPR
jgi:N-acyl-D-amino-acid deacylase